MKRGRVVLAAVLFASAPAWAQNAGPGPKPSSGLKTVDPKTPEGLRKLFTYSGQSLRLVSAHRGGARVGFPENCIATFEDTLRHTAAVMEVDPRYTRDGFMVLHHDDTLDRTTDGKGPVSDFTLEELKKLRLKDAEGNLTDYSMPTLDEAIAWARGRTVLILDRKGISMADRAKKVREHRAEAFVMLMAYSFEDARTCHAMNRDIMMEIFIQDRGGFDRFEKTGVPWSRVVVFVGHTSPRDPGLYGMIHAKGAICIEGTSRNLDRQVIRREVAGVESLGTSYRALLARGVDVIETDIPVEVGPLLFRRSD